MPVRVGTYNLTAKLTGFATAARYGGLLVGQTSPVNLQLAPSQLQETVTVTGVAPLVETRPRISAATSIRSRSPSCRCSGGAGPISRCWPSGSQENSVNADTPGLSIASRQRPQIHLDGQQITQVYNPANGQHRVSRDGIAEFEFVTSRFNATQGRSSGVIVNAITKSGTNVFAGSVSAFFRHD